MFKKLSLFAFAFILIPALLPVSIGAKEEYSRIVVLADAHLPTKTKSVKHILNKEIILAGKEKAIRDINGWDDVRLVTCLGDYAANYGSDEEEQFAVNFFKKLTAPFSPITGNHDFFYVKNEKDDTKIAKGTPETRKAKLERFATMFGLSSLSYTVKDKNALLVFLSVDEIIGGYSVKLSKTTMKWFSDTIEANKNIPIIVFCHAPLDGTLRLKDDDESKNAAYIEPKDEIASLLEKNPQVFMWVSGHTHTPPKNPSFMADYNIYQGHVMNIHTPTMDDMTVWSNNLYIYKDRVEVRTYNHKTEKFDPKYDRTVKYPVLAQSEQKKKAS
jgi:3',5'-cyclic-AMP phosphodiesterase